MVEHEGEGIIDLLNLPLFLTIDENVTDHLVLELQKKFRDIRKKKIIIFSSKGNFDRFKTKLEKFQQDVCYAQIHFIEDSTYDIAVDMAKKIAIEDFDYVIGFGGGKVLDTAKYAAYVSKKKFISIPTVLSNDGLASPIAVLKTIEGKRKSFGCKSPKGIIIDINIIKHAPDLLLMAGLGDTLSNYSALFDWKLEYEIKGSSINDFAYLLSDTALNMLLNSKETNIREVNFIRQLAQSLVLSGLAMEIAGNSRPCSGSEHLFSHSLDENYDINVPHGLQVALGSLVSCMLQNRNYVSIIEFINRYGIEISPMSLGITKDIFIGAWLKARATRPDRFTILNIIELTEGYLEKIYYEIMEVLR